MKGYKLFLQDARNFQIVYLSLFLCYGIFFLQWDHNIPLYLLTLGLAIIVQTIGIYLTSKNYTSIKSGLITGLGICLLLHPSHWIVSIVAVVIGISSKYVIKFKNKHLFNPANLGIIIAILTGTGTVNPGQWGNETVFVFFVGALACIVLLKVGRIDTSSIFLLSLFTVSYLYNCIYKGWPLDFVLHNFKSGSLLLFAFFMVTDPMTTPNHQKGRIIWAICLGILTFFLQIQHTFDLFGVTHYLQASAPIWALFLITPLAFLLDKIYVERKFEWSKAS